jgi:DNA-binding MarR family transcriptional regulator
MRNISEADRIRADALHFQELLVAFGRYRSLRNPIGDVHEELDLTPQQFHTILQLGTEGPFQMGELARVCGITEKTITGVVDRLERGGYVHRVRGSPDRRVIRVRLSPKGVAASKRIKSHMLEKVHSLMQLLDVGDRRQMLRIMEKLLTRLKSLAESSGSSLRKAAQ